MPSLLEIIYKLCKKMNILGEPPDGWPEKESQSFG
jgi:hypothetical protein